MVQFIEPICKLQRKQGVVNTATAPEYKLIFVEK
jgi:hypothetical protein